MANEETTAPTSAWLGNESLETKSVFSEGGTSEIPFSSVGRYEDWEVVLPCISDRVCSKYENYVFPMYEVVFKDMSFRLPFSDFQREVFRWTKLSPSQIHPNSYAFMRAFELVCKYLEVPAFKNVFYTIFTVQRENDWVSFRQTKKMFEIFAGKVRSFKERFLLVRPKSEAALNTLLGVAKDGSRFPFFPLCWKQDHFCLDSRDFSQTAPSLKEEETNAYQKICAFVQSLSRRTKTEKRGNPLMNADGTSVTDPRLINTLELVVSEDPDDCLGSYISFLF